MSCTEKSLQKVCVTWKLCEWLYNICLKKQKDYTSGSVWSSLWARAIVSNPFVRQLSRKGNLSLRRRLNREETSTAGNINQREGLGLMVWSTKVNYPINIVKYNEPNDVGLEPKGKQSDNLLNFGVTRTSHCRWNRQDLTHLFVTCTEHGKPVSLPLLLTWVRRKKRMKKWGKSVISTNKCNFK